MSDLQLQLLQFKQAENEDQSALLIINFCVFLDGVQIPFLRKPELQQNCIYTPDQ